MVQDFLDPSDAYIMQITYFTVSIEMVILIAELAVASLLANVTLRTMRKRTEQLVPGNPPVPVATTDEYTQADYINALERFALCLSVTSACFEIVQ